MKHRKVQLKPSTIHNIGLFPIDDILAGEVVIQFAWENIKRYIDISDYSDKKKAYWISLWGVQDNAIPFEQYFHPVNFINHSEQPNIEYDHNTGCYYAIKKLTENDEILLNYKDYNDDVLDDFKKNKKEI